MKSRCNSSPKDYKFTERPSTFDTRTPEDRGDTPEDSMKFDDMTSAGYWPVNPLYKVEILSSEKVGSGDSAEWVVTYSYKRNRYAWYNEESLQNNKIYRNRGMNREMKATFVYVKGEGWKIKELEVLKKALRLTPAATTSSRMRSTSLRGKRQPLFAM